MRHDDGYIPSNMRRSSQRPVFAQSVNEDWLDSADIGVAETSEQPAQVPTCPAGSLTYTIKAGDTLLALARTYNTTVAAITAANPDFDPMNFGPGDVICIPGAAGMTPIAPTPTPCPTGSRTYTIKTGDTLDSIAATFGVTAAALQDANQTINPYDLPVGTTICIPAATTTPAPLPNCPLGSKTYRIVQGDTLAGLARAYNTTVAAIIAMNPSINNRNLVVGQYICIPGAGGLPPTPAIPNCPLGSKTYQIVQGDTLANIARTYNTTVAQIIAMNPTINAQDLVAGQYICIPGAGGLPPTPAPTPAPTCPLGSLTYTIRAGESLRNIASRYNTTVADIVAMNPTLNPYYYTAGQIICIPGAGGLPPTTTCPSGYTRYTIASGDTYARIARRYGITVEDIMRANPTVNANQLQVGQVICLPPSASNATCPSNYTAYTIASGDTLSSILLTANISYGALAASNPNADLNNLAIGQTLCLPPARSRAGCVDSMGVYVIQANDTLAGIAAAFGVPVSEIMRVNPVMTPEDFTAGRMICIPEKAS